MVRSATLGKLFNITKNGSDTFDKNLDHHNRIAISTPKITPDTKPIKVSANVIPRCFKRSLDDKFKKVSNIWEGLLVIKLSIIFLSASTSQHMINITRIAS